jgi:hypothetical protein
MPSMDDMRNVCSSTVGTTVLVGGRISAVADGKMPGVLVCGMAEAESTTEIGVVLEHAEVNARRREMIFFMRVS